MARLHILRTCNSQGSLGLGLGLGLVLLMLQRMLMKPLWTRRLGKSYFAT